MGEGVNISASIRSPCTKYLLEVPETHCNILDHLRGLDTPVGRVMVPKHWAKLSKYIGEWGVQYLSF